MQKSDLNTADLRVAIVGAGNICKHAHIPALARLGVAIVSITDPNQRALDAIRALVPSSVRLLGSAACEISEQANCAVVCSPPALHAEQVQRLLRGGVHVLCEKPLACTFADAQRLRDQAAAGGLVLQAGYFRRFHPAARIVYHILRNQELGNPLACAVNAGQSLNALPASLMSRELSGGGVLMDYGVHVLDRLLSWFDRVEVDEYADDYSGGLEANCLVKARGWVNGRTLPIEIHLSRTAELGYSSTIDFEGASVSCGHDVGHTLTLKASNHSTDGLGARRLVGELKVGPDRDNTSYFCPQFEEFGARIHGAEEAFSNLEDAVRVNCLVDQCYARRDRLNLASGW